MIALGNDLRTGVGLANSGANDSVVTGGGLTSKSINLDRGKLDDEAAAAAAFAVAESEGGGKRRFLADSRGVLS